MGHNRSPSQKLKPPRSESPARERRCSCGELANVLHSYDAEFCPRCDRWLDKRCGDAGCEFCGKRPKRPSMSLELDPRQYMSEPVTKLNPPTITAGRRRL